MRIFSRRAALRLAVLLLVICALAFGGWWMMIRMPGRSWSGPLPPLTPEEVRVRDGLERDVHHLATVIGERNVWNPGSLARSEEYLTSELAAAGYEVRRETYEAIGEEVANLVAEIPGRVPAVVLVGAHYDTIPGCAGANDNGTGVAATLALARIFAGTRPERALRFVLFVNEEPPFFQTEEMGSVVHARGCEERGEEIEAMISLETIGCYLDEEGSQSYPALMSLLYPSTGDFIGFVSNVGSRKLVRRVVGLFREHARIPSEGGAVPSYLPGVGWSDHWAFYREGWPAVMVTDTAPFRYEHYHRHTDTADKIDYDRAARVVSGLVPVIREPTE